MSSCAFAVQKINKQMASIATYKARHVFGSAAFFAFREFCFDVTGCGAWFTCSQQQRRRVFMRAAQPFVVAWSRALQWQQKFKVSFYTKIPPNWVTSLLKMLQSHLTAHISLACDVSHAPVELIRLEANTCCVVRELVFPPPLRWRADIRQFWWTLSFHLLS